MGKDQFSFSKSWQKTDFQFLNVWKRPISKISWKKTNFHFLNVRKRPISKKSWGKKTISKKSWTPPASFAAKSLQSASRLLHCQSWTAEKFKIIFFVENSKLFLKIQNYHKFKIIQHKRVQKNQNWFEFWRIINHKPLKKETLTNLK